MLISEALGQDHQYLDECYEKLKSASCTDDKIKWRNMLTWNLARHTTSEELTVYPAMEKWLGEDGKALTKEDFAQHQAVSIPPSLLMAKTNLSQVKKDLFTFQFLSPSDPKFAPLLKQLMHDLHTRIEHESQENMPHLKPTTPKEESEKIAKSFIRTKQIVPTRSHPGAPTANP
jgi:hypothetical protein